jgi:ankyrin repeat protein
LSSFKILELLLTYNACASCKHNIALHRAINRSTLRGGYQERIQALLDRGVDVNAWGGEMYDFPLHVACRVGRHDLVKQLVNRGADIHAVGSRYGSILQAACWAGERAGNLVQSLLDRKVDVNAQGGYFGTALQAACALRGHDVVRLLLDHGADVNASGGFYGNALQATAAPTTKQKDESAQILELLLERGADVNQQGGRFGTALQAAAAQDRYECVRLLLEHGAEVNAQGGMYGAALQAAVHHEKGMWMDVFQSTTRLLLDHGADVNIVGGKYGTALQAACAFAEADSGIVRSEFDEYGKNRVVGTLIDLGADVHYQGGAFGSAWHAAVAADLDFLDWIARLRLLLDHGVDINDARGRQEHAPTALHAVLLGGHTRRGVDKVTFLLDRGANPYLSAGTYGYPLQAACAAKWDPTDSNISEERVRALFERYPELDVNAQGGLFGCALQAAAYSGQAKSIRLLLDQGADVNLRGGRYGSALNAAVARGRWNIVEVLLEAGAEPDCWRLAQQPDEEWMARVREDCGRGGVERYLKFWEKQKEEPRKPFRLYRLSSDS